jgi:phosphoribosylanthranilate isomerase
VTLVKICGLTRAEDVDCAIAAGADMLGFILVPWSPRHVDVATAASLRRRAPAHVVTVGVIADATPEAAATMLAESALDRVQIYGPHARATQERLGERAIVARRLPAEDEDGADPVLLDRAFDSTPETIELHAHWKHARAIGDSGRRVLLAGALVPETVADAIATARPWGVDVARGVEQAPGIKDHARVIEFIRAARKGDRDG